jgi:hypothetical protein
MTDLEKAARLALEALDCIYSPLHVREINKVGAAMSALREALAEQPAPVPEAHKQEPVGYFSVNDYGRWEENEGTYGEPLYTAPPKQWVGLTDEEIDALSQAPSLTDELMDCVDRLGSEADTVDPRVWQHLLVYAPKPEEEPVAWITNGGKGELWWHRSSKFDEEGNLIGPNQDDIPLYTAPPKKQWVGLTLNEAEDFYEKYTDRAELINAIDRFLEEKNA